MDFAAIIVAAGRGSRAGEGVAKQWRRVGGKPMLRWSAEALLAAGASQLVIVIRPEDQTLLDEALGGLTGWQSAPGGARRSDSVQAGLAAIQDAPAVLIHDAARPFLKPRTIQALLAALETEEAALPVLAVADTLKRASDGGLVTKSRDGLLRAQTPQAFRLAPLRKAYAALPRDAEVTDDAEVFERVGGRVVAVDGDPMLFKLTYPEDFAMAETLIRARIEVRTGQGFDAHRFGEGDAVWLCGVRVDHDQGLVGHSDADVGLHALTDAILGAIGQGDIGDHFPPSDPQWKGASSDRFLAQAGALAAAAGGRILNLDVTLICEQPKIKPYRDAMRARIAAILGLEIGRVSVKATTTEGMGFTGRREGIAAQAVANVELPA